MARTHYDNLQVTRIASEVVIRAAYKSLAQKNHPDKFDGRRDEAERVMKILNEAYAVLSDPARRKQHNEWIDQQIAAEHARERAGTLDESEDFLHGFSTKQRVRARKPEEAAGADDEDAQVSAGPRHHRRNAWSGLGGQNLGRQFGKKWLSPKSKGHLCLFSALLCAMLALRNGTGRYLADKQLVVSFLLGFFILIPFVFAYYRNGVLPAKNVAGSAALVVIFFGILMLGGVNMIFRGDVWYGLGATFAFAWALVAMFRG